MERAEAEEILDGDRETAVALLLRVGELVEANQRLEARVAELERRLNLSSRNSSLPPSQDPPSAPLRPGGRRSGRGRGGQPGHKGSHRPLLALEQVDEVVEHWPERCRSCAHVFGEPERVDAAEPWRHQVTELPTIAVRVTEHRLHGVRCPECATRTRAEPPREVPRSAFGPRLQAAVVTLAVRNRVSRRDTTELARELFGAELATGTVDAIVHRAGEALAGPYTQLEQRIKSASVVNIDETGWRTAGGNRTLWGALTSQTAVFRIAAGRHGFEARTLLGERFAGIVCSDRWRGYDYLANGPRLDRRTALLAGAGAALAAALPGGARAAGRRGGTKVQDLTHLFRVGTPMFPGVPRPSRETFVTVPANGFYGQIWNFWEHTGTHLDVPAHFIVGGRTTPQLTLDELMAPIAVIDISERAAHDPDTVVTTDDLRDYERRHGRIQRGSLVAMNSGWDARAGSEEAYRNTDASGTMHFPAWSADAVEWLIDERSIGAIGVDTLSLDPGNATAFVAHVALLAANRFGIENLANLGKIRPHGTTAFVGVIPWEDGSGGPARVVATW